MFAKNTVILLVAHGSRLQEANLEIHQMAERLQEELSREVLACFLELGEPSIPEGVDRALKLNPKEILALPYFLTQGRHVQNDITKILEDKARAYPETPIRVLDYVGAHGEMVQLLKKVVLEGV